MTKLSRDERARRILIRLGEDSLRDGLAARWNARIFRYAQKGAKEFIRAARQLASEAAGLFPYGVSVNTRLGPGRVTQIIGAKVYVKLDKNDSTVDWFFTLIQRRSILEAIAEAANTPDAPIYVEEDCGVCGDRTNVSEVESNVFRCPPCAEARSRSLAESRRLA